jgi:hypothetical protein
MISVQPLLALWVKPTVIAVVVVTVRGERSTGTGTHTYNRKTVSLQVMQGCAGMARTIYIRCIRYFWQGNHQIYGHIHTVLTNPTSVS